MPIRLLEDRIQSGTTPSLGYADRYPKVNMPASVLEAQRANQNISSPSGMKLPGAYELMATAASPAINFARGLMGFQDPFLTQTMQDRMTELESKKGSTGSIGYEDYGLPVYAGGGRFTGGLFNLALNNPVDFGLAGSVGRYGFGPEGRTGLEYDFTPDQDTGSTGSTILDFINKGGFKNTLANLNLTGTAHAAIPRSQLFKQQQIMNRRKQQMQETIRQAEAAEAAKKKKITTGGPPSITQKKKKKKKWTPTHQTGGGGGIHGGGGSKKGSMPTGTKGKNPWGRADGGVIRLFKYGGYLG